MKSGNSSRNRLPWGLLATLVLLTTLVAQESKLGQQASPLVTDWSHHHLIFSAPDVASLPLELRQEPRFWQQWWRRNAMRSHNDRSTSRRQRNPFKRDWAMSLGPGGKVGAGQYPAKFSFSLTTAHCASDPNPDFVAFNTSLTGSATQSSIIAFDNLYSGCTGATVPATYWAYNTGGKVVTSSVLALDGSQLAFVQSVSNQAQLVLLKWAASTTATVTSPDPITTVSTSQYSTCTAPCLTTIPFSGGANDTNSSPFLDYSGDTIYVGDDAGALHKFTPIFHGGTPAEVTTAWPVTVASGLKLSSPVFDSVSGRVFVGSGFSGTTGTQLFAVTASTGVVAGTSSSLGKGQGIVSGSLVDPSVSKLFVFVGNDGSTSCFTAACSAVYQFATNFTSGSGTKAVVGTAESPLYLGSVDHAYFTSGTGDLMVCGGSTFGAPAPTLYRVPITAGVMSTSSVSGPSFATSNVACSPVTDVFNPAANLDRVFASVPTTGDGPSCASGGCIMSLLDNHWQPSTAYSIGQTILDSANNTEIAVSAGTSGSTTPFWMNTCGGETTDGGITWANAGFLTPVTPQGWSHSVFNSGFSILDSNNNLECALVNSGMTGTSAPTWNATLGGITHDSAQTWRNVGTITSHSLPASGGTSGLIIDNVVAPGALGTSDVYFSTLGTTGTCGAGNGCAVQASQSGLN